MHEPDDDDDDGPIVTIEPGRGERDVWAEMEKELFERPLARKPRRVTAPPPSALEHSVAFVRARIPELPWTWIGGGTAALAACALLAWFLLSRGGVEPRGERWTRSSPEEPVRAGGLSADGERVAWVHGGVLQSASIATGDERSIPLPPGMLVEDLVWTGEENVIVAARMTAGFDAGLWRLSAHGAQPVKLRGRAHSPALSPDGQHLAFVEQDTLRKALWTMRADGSEPRSLFRGDDGHGELHPAWSPDGERLVFVRTSSEAIDAQLMTVPARGGSAVEVAVDFDPDAGAAWLDDRTLVFGRRSARGASLWKVPLDEEWQGESDPVELHRVDDVSHLDRIRVGPGGRRLSFVAVRTRVDAYVAELEDEGLGAPQRLTAGHADHWPVAWSPDGASLLMNVEADRRSEIVLAPVSRAGDPVRVTEGRVWAVTAGGDLLYGAADELATHVLRLASGGDPQLLGELPVPAIHSRSVLRCAAREGGACVLGLKERDVLMLHAFDPRQRSGKGRLLAKVGLGGRDYGWNVSPAGDRVAVVNGGRLVKLVDLRDGSVRKLTLRPSVYTQNVAWSADADALYVTGLIMHSAGGYVLYRVDLRGNARELWRTEDRWFDEPVPSPDGRRIALAARTTEADLWLWGIW